MKGFWRICLGNALNTAYYADGKPPGIAKDAWSALAWKQFNDATYWWEDEYV